jgi:hypothetical protein
MPRQNSTKRRSLKLVTRTPPVAEEFCYHHNPEWLPGGAQNLGCYVNAEESKPAPGLQLGDHLVTWEDAPLSNHDLVVIETRDENFVGRYHAAPGGYVRLEEDEEEGAYHIFKPSDILGRARVMYVVRKGETVKEFPLAEGGAQKRPAREARIMAEARRRAGPEIHPGSGLSWARRFALCLIAADDAREAVDAEYPPDVIDHTGGRAM